MGLDDDRLARWIICEWRGEKFHESLGVIIARSSFVPLCQINLMSTIFFFFLAKFRSRCLEALSALACELRSLANWPVSCNIRLIFEDDRASPLSRSLTLKCSIDSKSLSFVVPHEP